MTINELINARRLDRGISIYELARRLNIERGALYRSMKDKRDLRPDELFALMVFFKISIKEAQETTKRLTPEELSHA